VIEDAVFRRSSRGDGIGGDVAGSFEVLRESQEKGLVNFLAGAGAGGGGSELWFGGGGGGGEAHGTAGRLPDSPCSGDFFGGRGGGFESSGALSVSKRSIRRLNENAYFVVGRASQVLCRRPD
jgi:hypothetical protein